MHKSESKSNVKNDPAPSPLPVKRLVGETFIESLFDQKFNELQAANEHLKDLLLREGRNRRSINTATLGLLTLIAVLLFASLVILPIAIESFVKTTIAQEHALTRGNDTTTSRTLPIKEPAPVSLNLASGGKK